MSQVIGATCTQIIDKDDWHSFLYEKFSEMGANKAGSAGNEICHWASLQHFRNVACRTSYPAESVLFEREYRFRKHSSGN